MIEKEPSAFEPGTPGGGEQEVIVTEEARLEATDQVFAEIKEIANHPLVHEHVPEIEERLTYLLQKGLHIVAPQTEETGQPIEAYLDVIGEMAKDEADPDQTLPLDFYPLYPNDEKFGGRIAYFVQNVPLAAYGQQSHLIAVNMRNQETPRFVACAFLHELGHAQKAELEGRAGQESTRSIEERLQEEMEMWDVESKLMLAIGGQRYQTAVDQFILEIKEGWDQRRPPSYVGRGVALDACVGPIQAAEAVGNREASFNVYCHFTAADRYLDNDQARAYKLQMLRDRYLGAYKKQQDIIDLLP